MPRTFGSSFVTQLAKFADPLQPGPRPYWTAVFRFPAPVGNLYFSIGKTITVGANTYYGLITQTGDLSSLIDRREPLRLDVRAADIELDNLPGETGAPTVGQRISSYFAADLESTQIELGLAFDLGAGSFVQEIQFQGIAQADTNYGYRTAKLQLISYLEKYLGVQALRLLSNEDFPYIRSGDNGKGVPLVLGNVRRAPGRVVKERPWTVPQADPANTTGLTLTKVEVGPGAVSQRITITFDIAGDIYWNIAGSVEGDMTDGSTLAEYAWPTDPVVALNSRGKADLYISPDFWNGVPALGNVFTFDIDTTTMSEVIFSESPTATPISDLFQLYWGEYPIYSGEGVNNLTPSGIYKNIGDKTDTSSTSKTSFDAPIVTVNEVHYNAPGTQMMAGKYEYVQTYVVHDSTVLGGFAESGPSGAGEVELKADPLPPPANPPAVALEPFPGPPYDSGGPDKGTHRWAYSYVSDFGETQLGEPGGQFEINSGFVPDPTVEPEISYEGAGSLFLDGRESARAWVYTWVTPYGESGPSPARSVQMLDVPGSVYGIRVGIHWPAPPAGVVGINVYRTHYGGGTGDFTQINESGLYYFLGTSSTVGFLVDTGGGLPIGATAPALNTTGGGAYISLTSIQAGPPGTRKKRIYRTIAGDSGPFVYVDEISYADTTYVDRFNDAYIQALNPTFVPADPRTGAPRLPYDSDLSADQTHMAGSVRVELPKVPVPVAPQTVEKVKVYRSKKNKTGTHYFLRERSSPVIQGDLGANDSFIDSTADADLGDGLEQTERPPFGASGERDHLSGIALRVRHSKAILAKSIGVMVGKVGAPTADVTISVLGRHRIDQPEGDTLFSVTIAAAQVVGFQMQKRRIEATIIPPGWCWIVVDTPDADADNYYYISLAPAKADQVRFAKSSLQAKWIPQGGGIVFEIDGANFTLEPNAIDEAGQPVARAVLDVEIPSGIELSCDTKGLLDNGTGTYTGTAGALITNGADIAHWIGSYLGGLDETLIDVAGTFAATKAKYGTLFNNLSISIQENMTVLELLLRLGMETRSIPDWSFDKLEWKWLPAGIDPPYTPYKTLHRGDIVNESNDPQAEPKVNIERFGMDGVINSIDLKWDRKAWLQVNDPQAYARITSGQDVASVTKYTELTREDLFNFNFIHDEESAIALVAFYLSRYGTPNKALVTLTLVAPFLDIEKDDIVDFDGTTSAFGSGAFGTGPYGGGSGTGILYDGLIPNSIYQVEGKTVHPDFTVTLVLREL